MNIKLNSLLVTFCDECVAKIKIEGENKKTNIIILENGNVEIVMCFVSDAPNNTLCINDPFVYNNLPNEKTNILKAIVNKPLLKYRKLVFNCTIETIDAFEFTYEIVLYTSTVGFETCTKYISFKSKNAS